MKKASKISVRTTHGKPRRRAGLAFGKEPVVIETKTLTEDQLQAIKDDKRLLVEVEEEAKQSPKTAPKAARKSKAKSVKADKPADADASTTDKADD